MTDASVERRGAQPGEQLAVDDPGVVVTPRRGIRVRAAGGVGRR